MALFGVVLLVRSTMRRLGQVAPRKAAARPANDLVDVRPSVGQILGFSCVLIFSLTIASNWTQDVPARYGARHPGLEHTWLYPEIDTRPRSR